MAEYVANLLLGLLAVGALVIGMGFVLSKSLPRMPNKASRFVLFFVVGVPLVLGYAHIKHWALGYHRPVSLPVALILALLWAILCTFWGPQSHTTHTQ